MSLAQTPAPQPPGSFSGYTARLKHFPAAPTVACAALAGLALFLLPLLLPPNHDVVWLLYVGRRLLAGDRMFVDIVEVDPPLIVWLSEGIAWIAAGLHVPATTLFYLLVSGMALISCLAAARIARTWGDSVAPLIGAAAAVILLALPGYDFGQREHLATILALPYLVAAGTPVGGGLVASVAAGLGFALKPHFALAWIAAEGVRGARGLRLLRPAFVAVAAVGAVYVAGVLLLDPVYVEQARRLAPNYARFSTLRTAMLLQWPVWFVSVACAAALASQSVIARALAPAMGASIGFLVAALLQGKGFSYHFYPAIALAALSFVWALRPGFRMAAVILALVLPLTLARVAGSWAVSVPDLAAIQGVAARVRQEAAGRPVLALSDRTAATAPAIDGAGGIPTSPYPFLWMIPQFYPSGPPTRYRSPSEMEPFEREVFDQLWKAVLRRPPVLILFDRPRETAGRMFRIRDYFAADPRFAELFARCRSEADAGQFEVCAVSPVSVPR